MQFKHSVGESMLLLELIWVSFNRGYMAKPTLLEKVFMNEANGKWWNGT